MIRAVCPDAVSALKTGFITGWNVAPNIAYTITVVPGASSCAVWLFDAGTGAYLAGGAALVGTDQPVTLLPATSPGIGMVDTDLGYHLLVSTDGTEDAQTYGIGPFVDGSDQLSAIYTVDNLAVVQATAVIREGTHYTDDASIMCPLGFDGLLGDIVSATVHGASIVGDIESISFQADPSNMADVVTVRRMPAILPDAPVVIVPPVVVDDAAETDAVTATSGNVLTNDASGLTVVAVDGLMSNVGIAVAGSAGGVFTITANGAWTFDPDGDFATLSGSDTAETSVTYHAGNGVAEAMATLTVTVSSAEAQPWTPAEIASALWLDAADDSTFTLNGSNVSEWRDKSGNARHATQSTPTNQPLRITNGVQFDGVDNYLKFTSAIVQNTTTLLMVIEPTIENAIGFCFGQWSSGVSGRLGLACNQDAQSGGASAGLLNPFISPSTSGGTSGGWINHFPISNTATIIGVTYNIPGTENWKSYKNGVEQDSATITAVATGVNSSLGSANATTTTYPFDGKIREVVVLHTVSPIDRQKIEGYLAHKWDALLGVTTLVNALPSDHPCKSAPPTV